MIVLAMQRDLVILMVQYNYFKLLQTRKMYRPLKILINTLSIVQSYLVVVYLYGKNLITVSTDLLVIKTIIRYHENVFKQSKVTINF